MRSWRRSWATAGLSVALVVAVGSMAGPSPAQATAPQQESAVDNGTAKATATVSSVAPGVGDLDLAVQTGVAVAEQTNMIAQAQSKSADLGLIGTALTAESCGGDGVLAADDLPQPLRVDNRGGDVSESRDEVPLGPVGGFGLAASATEAPSAMASSEGAGVEVPGLLGLGGGTAVAETEVLPGEGREARARVDATLDLAGVLELDGMFWRARHRTGTERAVDGSFGFAGGTVGGLPLPLEELGAAEELINTTLAFTGITVELPRVQRLTEPNDLVRVTPLRIRIDDSEAGATVLGPVLNASRAQREELFTQLGEAVCELKSLLLVADVGVAIGAGTGFLTISIGGVEASSGEFEVGDAIGVPPPVEPVAPPSTGASGGLDATAPGTGGPPTSSTTAPAEDTTSETALTPAADTGPLERFCETVHPFEWPSCSKGAAPAAGAVGLLATGAMVGFDIHRQRRGTRADSGDVPGDGPGEVPPA